jgi:hypothetical protein
MAYSRDEAVAELMSFYEFLVGLHLPDDAIKRPPVGGWPQVTSDQLGFLNRNETVVDLLRHLLYLRTDEYRYPFMIY